MFILAILTAIVGLFLLGWGLFWRTEKVPAPVKRDRYGDPIAGSSEGEFVSPHRTAGNWIGIGGLATLVLAVLFFLGSMYYSQEAGEAKVLRDWTGNLQEEPSVTSGAHWKEPWVDAIDWDIRNQSAMFAGKDGSTTHEGQDVQGAQISFTDKDGVSGNMDIQVLYDIDPNRVVDLTYDYTDQNDFRIKVVENDIKALPRDVLAKYTTIKVYNDRAAIRAEIEKVLSEAWANEGVSVKNVNIQGIRYPKAVKERFEEAQRAQTAIVTAEADAKALIAKADGEAAAAIAAAQGQKTANDLLASSLTPQILQQRWIDAIGRSGTIIVPQDFTSLGNLSGGGQ